VKNAPKFKLIRLRGRNQITLPNAVIESLALEEGDYLAAVLDADGIIRLRPAKLAVAGTPEAEEAIQRAEADLTAGRSVEFGTVEEFKDEMLANHDEQMPEEEPPLTTMLVHVAKASTSTSVQCRGIPIFTRNIDAGSGNASVDQIAEEVRGTVEFFQSAVEGPGIGEIFLSAGPPPMSGLAQKVEKAVGLPVRELSAAEAAASPARHAEHRLRSAVLDESVQEGKFKIDDLKFNVARPGFSRKITS
jgi:antitoxin component of MazEF toxin-antitoxin module